MSNLVRLLVSSLPDRVKPFITDIIAASIYWPISRISAVLERFGFSASALPLYYYRTKSFYTLRTDSRDRFGTPLEKRFSKQEIEYMMCSAGLKEIRFGSEAPFWCVLGKKI